LRILSLRAEDAKSASSSIQLWILAKGTVREAWSSVWNTTSSIRLRRRWSVSIPALTQGVIGHTASVIASIERLVPRIVNHIRVEYRREVRLVVRAQCAAVADFRDSGVRGVRRQEARVAWHVVGALCRPDGQCSLERWIAI